MNSHPKQMLRGERFLGSRMKTKPLPPFNRSLIGISELVPGDTRMLKNNPAFGRVKDTGRGKSRAFLYPYLLAAS